MLSLRAPFKLMKEGQSMKQLKVLMALVIVVLFAGLAIAGSTGDESLQKLLDGNKRYVDGIFTTKDVGYSRRQALGKGQKPFAVVLTCSDSRVPPEILFDQGLGDIFVIRVAGNVVEPIELGSIEYGAEHLNSPLIFILGHTKCGAVSASIEATGAPEGNIGAIVKKILPAVEAAKKKGGTPDQMLETAIHENMKNVYNDLITKSTIISHLVHEGKVKIVAGEYNIETGKVAMIDLPKMAEGHKGH